MPEPPLGCHAVYFDSSADSNRHRLDPPAGEARLAGASLAAAAAVAGHLGA